MRYLHGQPPFEQDKVGSPKPTLAWSGKITGSVVRPDCGTTFTANVGSDRFLGPPYPSSGSVMSNDWHRNDGCESVSGYLGGSRASTRSFEMRTLAALCKFLWVQGLGPRSAAVAATSGMVEQKRWSLKLAGRK